MIPNLLGLLAWSAIAISTPAVVEEKSNTPSSPLERYRLPLSTLAEASVGTTSRAVRYDWRKMLLGVGAFSSQYLELNNFYSLATGVNVRRPLGSFMLELGFSRVTTWGSSSTQALSLTPYRQEARPSRFELSFNAGFPLAEGVATQRFSFLPAAEVVMSLQAGLRVGYYPGQTRGMNFRDTLLSLARPALLERELTNLEPQRLPGMKISASRIAMLVGLGTDIYFHSGLFLNPRAMLAIPLGSSSETGLGSFWELTLSAGWAF